MNKTRVLIIDGGAEMRRMLTAAVEADPGLRVTGASSARLALDRLGQVGADVVVLGGGLRDLEPLRLLEAIRANPPRVPVLFLSAETGQTLQALALGASECLALPEGDPETRAAWLARLPGRVRQLAGLGQRVTGGSREWLPSGRVDLVAIGSSTGGPNALQAVLGDLPTNFPVPIVIVQHMPPDFTRQLAARLAERTPFVVREAAGGEMLLAGCAWIAPGDHHMTVARSGNEVRLRLNQGPQENSCRPSADVLFRSVAAAYGEAVLAVVLTGMGQDGTRGCEALRAAGAQVLVQDEKTSVVWGMPGNVVRAGLAHLVLPLDQMAPEICRRVRRGRSASGIELRDAVSPGG